jgi:hypothetical protein
MKTYWNRTENDFNFQYWYALETKENLKKAELN